MKLNFKGGNGSIVNARHRDIFDRYLNEITKHKPLSKEEEKELFIRVERDNDQIAIEKICKHNLLFVVAVARKYSNMVKSKAISLEDLVNEGNIGLCIAIKKFDHTQDIKFITYAVWWIRQSINIAIANHEKTIRVPSMVMQEILNYKRKERKIVQKLGREVSVEEVFDEMVNDNEIKPLGTLERLEMLILASEKEISLSSPIDFINGNNSDTELIDMIPSLDDNPEEFVIHNEVNIDLKLVLSKLPHDVNKYIIDHYGLFGNAPMTYEEMENKYGVHHSRIRNLLKIHLPRLARKKDILKTII